MLVPWTTEETRGIGHARFGPLIGRRRRLAGLTQKDLAERPGLSVRAIRKPNVAGSSKSLTVVATTS